MHLVLSFKMWFHPPASANNLPHRFFWFFRLPHSPYTCPLLSQAFGPWSTSGSSPLRCASLRPTATSPAYDTCSVAKLIPMPAPEVVVPYTRPVSGAIPLAPACYCSTEQTQICSTRRAWHPCTYVAHQPRLGKTRLNMAYWSRNSDWGCHRPRLVWPLAT